MVKDFPSTPFERVMRKAGAERVSAESIKEMRSLMLEIADKIAAQSIAAAKHAKRVTIKREDILLATRSDRMQT
jgi:histone H3/H4